MAQSCRKPGSILPYEHAHVLIPSERRRGDGNTVWTATKMVLGVKYVALVQEERTLVNFGAIYANAASINPLSCEIGLVGTYNAAVSLRSGSLGKDASHLRQHVTLVRDV